MRSQSVISFLRPAMQPLPLDSHAELRPFVAADAGAAWSLITENRAHLDQWLRWSSSIQTLDDVRTLIDQFHDRLRRGDGFHLGLWLDGVLAGGCVCWRINRQNRNSEIGYWLGHAFLGRGLATRAVRKVLGYLFAVEDLHRVEMQCAVDNAPSRAIPERLGFRLEGIRRESHWITSRFLDHAVYGLLVTEWRKLTTE
jgi:ribosomal-protein-serine acetyltransferase